MKIKELVSALALDEKGLHQATVGDVRQLVKLLAQKIATCADTKKCFDGYCGKFTTKQKVKKQNSKKLKK